MNIPFQHQGANYTLSTESNLIKSWTKTVPLFSASEDLRLAAVAAKVAFLRAQNREQFNPLVLQDV